MRARRREQQGRRPCVRCAWLMLAGPHIPPSCLTHTTICGARAGGQWASGDSPSVSMGVVVGQAGSPAMLTVNRPLVLLRLPTKNRAPCTDRVAGKGTSDILQIAGVGVRAMGDQQRRPFAQKRTGQRRPRGVSVSWSSRAKCHGLGGLKQRHSSPLSSGGQESNTEGLTGPHSC